MKVSPAKSVMIDSHDRNQGSFLIPKHGGYYQMRNHQRWHLKSNRRRLQDSGKVGRLMLWILGAPIPVLVLFFLIRGWI
ncbi:hypothetical protein SAMN05660653_00075 [Desulfonatronum thiosulfatophilum]|uniref:Uncharacterized protein n=1 Tax=Desulfonatronum thiosulfatophilum TaxID=617002 RepID=A0A1G6A1K8_9BACT|nr:hypothetical protein SAMN05660653_00075 [Desulfonatronum thiosulfatophilum]